MPRRKKTREQKKKADARKVIAIQEQEPHEISFVPTYTFASHNTPVAQKTLHQVTPYLALVKKDLVKTAFVSFFILILQIIVFILLKNHVLAFSLVRY